MKKVGILLNERDYFLPYISWLFNNQEDVGYTIVAVHTNNPRWAKENNIPKKLIQTFDNVIENSDLVISLSYWNIIKKETIEKVPMGIINFHHSYGLKYRGRHSATWAIRKEEKIHGSTMHFIDKNLDAGKIIDTDFFEIEKFDVAEDVFLKANEIGLNLLKENFGKVINQEHIEYKMPSDDYFSAKEKNLCHEIEVSSLNNKEKLLREIYLKMDNYDTGKLKRRQLC